MSATVISALWFLPLALPISIWVAWSDMKTMKIPNKAVITLAVWFLLVGLFALPLAEFGWRLVQLVGVLAIGFVLNQFGSIGAGDAKFAAAMAPFIHMGDARILMMLFATVLLAAYATHRLFGLSTRFRALVSDWESWTHKDFPMGLALGGTLIFYLLLALRYGA